MWKVRQVAKCDTTVLLLDFDAWKHEHGVKCVSSSVLALAWTEFIGNLNLSIRIFVKKYTPGQADRHFSVESVSNSD